ncbi:MAG: hypothetical protein U9N59_09965 [Campylobacterota bacterium]|nr:hypothetical protein [Campylobacterota bacterium]
MYLYDEDRYNNILNYFHSLKKEDIQFEDSFTLFEVCKIIVAKKFGTEEEDRNAYHENLINLSALMHAVQPWYHAPKIIK